MNKEQPTYSIAGTVFIVDAANMELREQADPENTISVMDMKDTGEVYRFQFDKDIKNIPYELFLAESKWEDVVTVDIPHFAQLDPQGFAARYQLPIETLAGKSDGELIAGTEAFQKRVGMGQLPTIEIADHLFYVDVRMGYLRPKDDFTTLGINLECVDDGAISHAIYYHIPTKSQYYPAMDMNGFPKDVVRLDFPGQGYLDPVGLARRNGLPDTYYLKDYPLVMHSVAKITPIEKTQLADRIKANAERLQQQRKAKQYHRKGKGLK